MRFLFKGLLNNIIELNLIMEINLKLFLRFREH